MNKKLSLILVMILLMFFFMLSALEIYHCPFKYIFGISCPTCGLTRALLCVLQFDFPMAFYYHLLWPVAIIGLIIYALYELELIHIRKNTIMLLLYSFCFLNLIYYFYRLFSGSSIVYFDFTESLIYKIINVIK